MSVAETYINFKGSKVAIRIVNTEASNDVVAHYPLGELAKSDDETVNSVGIERVLYSGEVNIYRGASLSNSASYSSGTSGLLSAGGLATAKPDPKLQLNGDGDWNLTAGMVYHGDGDEALSIEVGAGGTCFLLLSKNSTYVSSYQG